MKINEIKRILKWWLLTASVSVSVWVWVIWRIANRRHLEVWRFLIWQLFWVCLSIGPEYRHTSNFFSCRVTNRHTSNMMIRNSAGKQWGKHKLKQKLRLFFITLKCDLTWGNIFSQAPDCFFHKGNECLLPICNIWTINLFTNREQIRLLNSNLLT